ELSMAQGSTAASAAGGYAGLGVALHVFQRNFERGYEFVKLARRLVEQDPRRAVRVRVNFMAAIFLDVWRQPLASLVPVFLESFSAELEYGDLQKAGFSLITLCMHQMARGHRLDELDDELER